MKYENTFTEFTTVRTYYSDIHSALDNAEDYDDLLADLAIIKADAIAYHECEDEPFILMTVSLMTSSAYFWMPTIDGGEGHGLPCGSVQSDLGSDRNERDQMLGNHRGPSGPF